jgi:hypothetical protein
MKREGDPADVRFFLFRALPASPETGLVVSLERRARIRPTT